MRNQYKKYAPTQINIIPFLDVLLVLVAVLILLTPFMAKSIGVDLPKTETGQVITQDSAMVFEVHSDGSIWHEGLEVSNWDDLSLSMDGATTARIFVDKNATFTPVTIVMDKLAQRDIHNIEFATKD